MKVLARLAFPAALPALLFLLATSCSHVPGKPVPSLPEVRVVERDTAWSGEVRVDGVVHVRKGATLTIAPGTRVRFGSGTFAAGEDHEGFVGPGFKVEGRIVALGTEDAPIRFAPADGRARPGAWDKLLFTFSEGSRFEWCTFEGGRYAFHVHFSELSVSRCTFRENEEGMRMGNSKVRIEDSAFLRNAIRGINFRDCRNEIRRNLVYGNGDGIFLHSKDAASVLRENAVYANRHFNLRMGDLHEEDFDASGNWWGSRGAVAIREGIYDGDDLPGIGRARFEPALALPPVTGSEIRGVFVSGQTPVEGAEVRALATAAGGLLTGDPAGIAVTDADGFFRLALPPGRWFLVGRKGEGAGSLFSFPGRNPVAVELGEGENVAMPAVPMSELALASRVRPSPRQGVSVTATLEAVPVAGATVQAFRPDAPDFRGPGEASARTVETGSATLSLRPGRYLLTARSRPGGAALGVVDEGGAFGVWPGSPIEIVAGTSAEVEIPMAEKRGLIGGSEAVSPPGDGTPEIPVAGSATLSGAPAAGHIVYFYRPGETVGRPIARSSVLSAAGGFSLSPFGEGEFVAFLRKSVPGVPGGVGEERFGPLPVSIRGGRLSPPALRFGEAAR